ncbi:CotH kinase family protein [Larkinella soli]|uniref:CotH kinase family protein n=1 Tax=Larkinella soli TaxID=1770527 RepID=UPI000FFBF20A|nr:CotH kinase family protein [Larkinella soli]
MKAKSIKRKSWNGFAFVLLFTALRTFYPAVAQSVTAEAGSFQVDNNLKLIVCNKVPAFPTGAQPLTIQFDKVYTFSEPTTAFQVGKPYKLSSSGTGYTLYFTDFPIVHLNTNGAAISNNDDILTMGTLTIAGGAFASFSGHTGLRIRGGLSRGYAKKSYRVELFTDATGNENVETSLLGFREDSEWLLLALYKEPQRANNMLAHGLWMKMHQLYYAAMEPDALPTIRLRYVDVFINGAYNGIYAFTEPMDRKQLKLKKTEDDGTIRGELYKAEDWSGATRFDGVPPLAPNTGEIWAGYEIKLPKEPYWNNLLGLVEFVVNAPAEEFRAHIGEKMRVDNLIDYFIFLNVTSGRDNFGKNIYVARYKENEPYFLIPWDLDATFGYLWDGTKVTNTRDILTNGLFRRLLSIPEVRTKMKERWFTLRAGVLATNSLKQDLAGIVDLMKAQGGYAREGMKWNSTLAVGDQAYVSSWTEKRLAYLDEYFSQPDEAFYTYEGYAESIGCTSLRGWVWDKVNANSPLTLELLDGPNVVGTVVASEFRSDVKNAGKGTGNYGFNVPTPAVLKDNQPHSVGIRVQGTSYQLKYAPKTITCPATTPPGNQPPVKPGSLPSLTATLNQPFSATLPAFTDPENGALTHDLTGLPANLAFDPSTRVVSGTPVVAGPFSLTYSATDGPGAKTTATLTLTVGTTPPPPVTSGNFEGYLDGVTCTTLSGWVWDRNRPNTALTVEILDGGAVLATLTASNFRQDLKNAGKGNGEHGFRLSVPSALLDGQAHAVSARVQNTTFVLKNGKSLTCPSGGRVAASAENGGEMGLTVFPNPAESEFEVRFQGSRHPAELSVADLQGRMLYLKMVPGTGPQKQRVRLADTRGVVIVRLKQGNTFQSRKVIIGK